MDIEVKNCNNIDFAAISITENKLNIKLASNGTGKSTIARAILLNTTDTSSLVNELLPFKLRESNPENKKPEIIGMNHIQNVMCFNEDYVRQFYFQKDELINNSFDILIRTDSYKAIEQEIDTLVSETKEVFTNNQELELKSLYETCQNGYEKLQIFRFFDFTDLNFVIQKFINETYHIENEFICQLDPAQFDTIPEYVISECDKILMEV